jgi:hypothetical protein
MSWGLSRELATKLPLHWVTGHVLPWMCHDAVGDKWRSSLNVTWCHCWMTVHRVSKPLLRLAVSEAQTWNMHYFLIVLFIANSSDLLYKQSKGHLEGHDNIVQFPFILYDYLLIRLTLFYRAGAFLSALSSNFSEIRRLLL